MDVLDRRSFLKGSAMVGGGLVVSGPLQALGMKVAGGQTPPGALGYGPLVPKGDLALPEAFDYAVVDQQGTLMSDGNITPGIFDGTGAYKGKRGTTILVRNHENRRQAGEIPVVVPEELCYDADPAYVAGNTKMVFERNPQGAPQLVDSFAVLGGTDTNCAGGVTPWDSWITCEEVVNRSAVTGIKHGYCFEVDAHTEGPVDAVPIVGAGRFVHEAVAWLGGILYLTEDRSLATEPALGTIGSCFYRYVPDRRIRRAGELATSTGVLQALKLAGEVHANMDVGRVVGQPYPVEWVTVPEPDHDDDTDSRTDRVAGATPTRIQAQDRGAAFFDREEGIWADGGKLFFDCTTGGAANLGQVWEYDTRRETVTLIYESTNAATLQSPDNVVIVPSTGDILLQEDGAGDQFLRGVTRRGEIYDFARTITNDTEFCGGTFDPREEILYVHQQGDRGSLPGGPAGGNAVTYAIWGPFHRRRR